MPKHVLRRSAAQRLRIAAALTAVATTGVVVVLVVSRGGGTPTTGRSLPRAGPDTCVNQVVLYLRTDQGMRDAAAALAGEPRVVSLATLTKQEGYVRFRDLYRDDPDLLAAATPATVPASLWLVPAAGVDRRALADELGARFQVDPRDRRVRDCPEPAATSSGPSTPHS
ncbi:hypothetical protein F0L68_31725 [Solihabitans fulvus]|uniref:FtsX extracellular domain-containing protein n=1 Tax=Solihabitans fulvus TaxID=1892852 RepID=A0A5B2WSP5_9PSEU|nr:hypothetical protein [Solihabitans fulvus]KAA2253850.1 hypothetical protein F0L68_31725 [Solihabitans fulvus]